LAVNNLLSHEDDVPDEQDGEDSLPVIPSGGKFTLYQNIFTFNIQSVNALSFFPASWPTFVMVSVESNVRDNL